MTQPALETQVALNKAAIENMVVIAERLEEGILRSVELSRSINTLIAVHEERFVTQEKTNTEIWNTMEDHREETQNEIRDLAKKFTDLETRVANLVESSMDKIRTEISAKVQEDTRTAAEKDQRIRDLERRTWIMTGGSVVLGFLAKTLFTKIVN